MAWCSFSNRKTSEKIVNRMSTTDKQSLQLNLVKSLEPSSKGFFFQEKATVDLSHYITFWNQLKSVLNTQDNNSEVFSPPRIGQPNIILQVNS